MPLRVRRGTNAERQTITPEQGELIYTTDTKRLYIGDGINVGGLPVTGDPFLGIDNIVEDESPELGGNLSLNGFDITGDGNIAITGRATLTNLSVQSGGNAGLMSNLIPTNNNSLTLGNATKRFKNIYASNLNIDGELNLASVNADIVGDDSVVLVDSATSRITTSQLAQAGATDQQVLKWSQANSRWQASTNSLALLADVNATNPLDGQALVYDSLSATWIPGAGGGGGASAINDLTDVSAAAPGEDDLLVYKSGEWVNSKNVGTIRGSLADSLGNVVVDTATNDIFVNYVKAIGSNTIVVDVINQTFRGATIGEHFGDTQGTHEGEVIGNLLGNDSSVIVDHINDTITINTLTVNGNITGPTTVDGTFSATTSIASPQITATTSFSSPVITGNTSITAPDITASNSFSTIRANINTLESDSAGGITYETTDDTSRIRFKRSSANAIASNVALGRLLFVQDVGGVETTTSTMSVTEDVYLYIPAPGGVYDYNNFFKIHNTGKVGISTGSSTLATEPQATLEVGGPMMPGVYADATARDAAIPSPVAGMMIYLTSTNKHQGYNGTTWNDMY